MRDFTPEQYSDFLITILKAGYVFQTLEEFFLQPKERVVILRHDVDLKAPNSLCLAKIESALGVRSSYYFRVIPQSNQPKIIKEIVSLGHEIGYHYDDLSYREGDFSVAISSFKKNLEYFRNFYPIKTISMHGSPLSKIDNRDLWKKYDYRDYNVIGEPYFDIDYSKVLYLTDTGRCWNGKQYSVRDKVTDSFEFELKTTKDIMLAFDKGILPSQIMITTHPQRWIGNNILWLIEFFFQGSKNQIKKLLIKYFR